jgi:hypothetical protein
MDGKKERVDDRKPKFFRRLRTSITSLIQATTPNSGTKRLHKTARPLRGEVNSYYSIIVNHLTHLLTHARRSEHLTLLHGSEPGLNLSEKEGLA